MRHIIPISGKDSLATAIIQTAKQPELNYEYVFNPTGLELPEVYEWLEQVEGYFGKPIARVGADLLSIIESYNYFLPSQQSRYCTFGSKIKPFTEWIGKEECTVYYGIRADEDRGGFDNSKNKNIIPVYPLKQAGIVLQGVYILVNKVGLKPPTFFWQSVYEEVKERLGYDPKYILPEWMFDMLFAWRSRTNCDRCFNQRLYEWVGLYEHYPDRFWDSEEMEHKGGEQTFTWNSNKKSLHQIAEEAEAIKEKRIQHILKVIRNFSQLKIFDDSDGFIDVFQVTSCGLFCGK